MLFIGTTTRLPSPTRATTSASSSESSVSERTHTDLASRGHALPLFVLTCNHFSAQECGVRGVDSVVAPTTCCSFNLLNVLILP